jgi:membrane protease YdiL (CAAX protease family)
MKIKKFLLGLIGFVILDLYFNLVPSQFGNAILQFVFILVFFPIAFFIAKLVGLNGLKGMGLTFHLGWQKNFFLSFMIGFSFWMLMYGIQFLSGDLKFVGFNKNSELIMSILLITIGFFIGSLINDLVIRGYVINLLRDKIHISLVFTISILIYALDDFWYAGFSLSNIIFSMILGLSLTYVFYKTDSIWANTGIHFGLNLAYGLFFGLVGNTNSAIFIIEENSNQTSLASFTQYLVPALMFLFILWAIKFYNKSTNH